MRRWCAAALRSSFRPRRRRGSLAAADETVGAPLYSEGRKGDIDSNFSLMENIISNYNFSQGLQSWNSNGSDAFVASEESAFHAGIAPHSGRAYAVVTSRTQTWHGLEQDITKKIVLNTQYTVSAWVRVHGDLHEPVGVQATLFLESKSSLPTYHCINRITAKIDCWYKLEGTFSLSTMPERAVFYLEGPPAGVDLLIDSVVISFSCKTEASTSSTKSMSDLILINPDFTEGLQPWKPICCHAYVASEWSGFLNGIRGDRGANYAVVTKRTETWHGLEQDIAEKVHIGTTYTVSAYVRVYGNFQGPSEVKATLRLHHSNNSVSYIPVGRALVSKEKWEKLEGSFSLTSKERAIVFYLEGPPSGVDLLIDFVGISQITKKLPQHVKPPTNVEGIVKNPHFEDGLCNWSGRGCKLLLHKFSGYNNVQPLNGSCFASATERSHTWNGIQQDVASQVQKRTAYDLSSYVRIAGNTSAEVCATLWIQEHNGHERYISIGKIQATDKEWSHLSGKFFFQRDASKAVIFIEGPPSGVDILVDSFTVAKATKARQEPPPTINSSLYGVNIVENTNLNKGLAHWNPMGSCRLNVHTESPHMLAFIPRDDPSNQNLNGRYILATNRSETWMGPSQTITDKLSLFTTYRVSAWVRTGSQAGGRHHVNVTLGVDDQWVNGGQAEVDGNQWYEIKGAFRLEKRPGKVVVYVQGPAPDIDLAVMALRVFAIDRKARFDYLREKTDQVRKRDVVLRFQGSNASNHLGASLRVQQIANSFPFGTCIGSYSIANEDLADFYIKNFNWAVFENEVKWYWTEPDQGKLNYRDADQLLEFCRRHEKEVRGHCIFWEVEDAVQQWLRSLSPDDLFRAVQSRLEGFLSRYHGQFRHHDVNNEMLHGTFYRDRLGLDIRAHMFREAHRLDPDAVLFVNDYNVVDCCDSKSTPDKYVEHVLDLQERGAPVGGIGVQGHITHPVGDIICSSLDKLAILGLPIWVTELDVAAENVHIRADDLEVVLREAYAHPAVEGIVMWGFWELFMWRKDAHLVDADGSVNEAGRRFLALKQEWLSYADGHIDPCSEFKFRGFPGTYTVEVATASGVASREFVVSSDGAVQELCVDL